MPSLRRTVSSPMVRASPYRLASYNPVGTITRPRRSGSGSETVQRRVLADIEWWRVLDGQQPEEPELQDQDSYLQLALDGAGQVAANVPSEQILRPSTPVADTVHSRMDGTSGATSLMAPFAALTISAIAPMTPPRTRRNRQEASDSSVELTPESSPRSNSLYDMLFSDGLGLDFFFDDTQSEMDPPSMMSNLRPSTFTSTAMMRSVSFGGFDTLRDSGNDRFEDVIFL